MFVEETGAGLTPDDGPVPGAEAAGMLSNEEGENILERAGEETAADASLGSETGSDLGTRVASLSICAAAEGDDIGGKTRAARLINDAPALDGTGGDTCTVVGGASER